MAGQPGAELAPRDIVARAIRARRARGHRVFLDARKHPGSGILQNAIPSSPRSAKWQGSIPRTDPIPVRPAVHYHMGGISVDIEGRSTDERLVGLRRGQPYRAAWRQPARQ